MSQVCSFLSLQDHVVIPGKWTFTWFDASRQQMILYKDNSFYLWSPFAHNNSPDILLSDKSFSQDILLAKVSMDSRLLALLPSTKVVIVHDLKAKRQWKISIKNIPGNCILPGGLIWSEHGGNSQDLVVVTSRGLELHKVSSARGQCKLSRSIMQTTQFFCYEPNFRAVLLASITHDHTIEITGFYLRYDLSDAPRLELPPPDKMPVFRLKEGANAKELRLVVLYGVLYLCVHYSGAESADTLALYDLSRGQTRISQTFSHPLYMSSDVDISCTDNILCCHCLQSQLTLLLDVRQDHSHETWGAGEMSFGACTMVVSEDTAVAPASAGRAEAKICKGTNDLTSPVKQLLQGPQEQQISDPMATMTVDTEESSGIKSVVTSRVDSFVDHESRCSINFEADDVSQQRWLHQHQQTQRHMSQRHVHEPYTTWKFLPPNWVWDAHSCQLWRVKCNFSAVVSSVHSAERIVHFLSARGLPVEAPRPVYHSDSEEDGRNAKALLFYIINKGIVEQQSNTWFYYLFTEFAKSYAVEYHKTEHSLVNGAMTSGHSTHDMSGPQGKLRSSSVLVTTRSGQSNKQHVHTNGTRTAPSHRLFHLARQAQARRSSGAGSLGGGREVDEEDLWDDTRVGGSRGPFLPDVSDEPLEPVGHMSYSPDISSIGQRAFQRHRLAPQLSSSALGPSILPDDENFLPIRRNVESGIVISQSEMLSLIWLPMSLKVVQASFGKPSENVEFLISILKSYISSLKSVAVEVNASLSLLLLNLLVFQEKYKELAHIIQLQLFSDSPEFAVALLDMADAMVDVCVNSGMQSAQIRKQFQYAIATLDQAGRDMLWRGQDHGTVIRWMLGHGRLDEALRLSVKFKNIMKNHSVTVHGVDYLRAAFLEISLSSRRETDRKDGQKVTSPAGSRPWRQNKYAGEEESGKCRGGLYFPEDERVALLNSLHAFLSKWDSSLFSVQQSTGVTRLAAMIDFPDNILNSNNTLLLKSKYGYTC